MIEIFYTLRSKEWWEPKLVPLLFIYYLTVIRYSMDLMIHIGWMGVLILAIASGAIYVSVLNDYTDLKTDLATNKSNRLQKFSPLRRKLILLAATLLGLPFSYLFFDDLLSLSFALGSYASFSLYSIPPFRLKNRKVLGVIADACGSHLFPSLLIVSSTSHKMGVEINPYWLLIIGIWSFSYGLRSILWHQFWDIEKDLSSNLKTFATTTKLSIVKPIEKIITLIELITLVLILLYAKTPILVITFTLYFLILIGYKKLKIKPVMVLTPKGPYHIFMTEYYLVLLPLSLIVFCSFKNPTCWILVIFHLIFFPTNTKLLIRRILLILNIKRVNFRK